MPLKMTLNEKPHIEFYSYVAIWPKRIKTKFVETHKKNIF